MIGPFCLRAAFPLLVAGTLLAEPPPLVPRRVFFAEPQKSAAKLSPDGTRVSYQALGDGIMQMWVAPVDAPAKAMTVLAPGTKAEVLEYHWAYTGEQIIYLSRYHGKQRVFAVELQTHKVRALGPPDVDVRIEKLSPQRPHEILLSSKSDDTSRLFRVNILTGEESLVLENHGFDRIFADGQFHPRIALRNSPEHDTELLRFINAGMWERFASVPHSDGELDRVTALGVDHAGETFYFLDNRHRDNAALKAIDLASGQESVLAQDDRADLQPFVAFHPITGKAQAATSYYGEMRRHLIDQSLAADFEFLRAECGGEIGVAGRSVSDDTWLVIVFDGGPWRYFRYDRAARQLSFLFSTHDGIDPGALAKRRAVSINTRDGLQLPGWLYLPSWVELDSQHRPKKPLPMLICVHGGPGVTFQWNDWFHNRMLQLLANRGYAVYWAEFRGTGGLGKLSTKPARANGARR
jgi:dipeptidyl aminopeptidase/acylaminoacyl peptidase